MSLVSDVASGPRFSSTVPRPVRSVSIPPPRPVDATLRTPPPNGLVRALNSDRTLFDSVFHSAAVVGLNTSAELEAGIVGRPVFTVLAGEHAEGQQGTIHFQYLLKERGGFVEVAPDFETHRRQLAAAVRGEYDADAIRTFIERFLRPHGWSQPATPVLVSAIEEFARSAGVLRRQDVYQA